MKKWLWAIPVAMIIVTAVAIAMLNARDIVPENMVSAVDPKEIAAYTEAEVLTMLETDDAYRDGDFFVLDEGPGMRLYVTKSEPETPAVTAYNVKVYSRDIGNGWTYVLEYICGVTFSSQYDSQSEKNLGGFDSVTYYLRDKADCAEPAPKSKSEYAVEAHVTFPSGDVRIVFLDPKTKLFIGAAQQN